jgi:hypothetical protein
MGGWLALMQHYGLPTRLMDWTESSAVAAYFATETNPTEDGNIWLLIPMLLAQSVGYDGVPSMFHSLITPLLNAAFDRRQPREKLVYPVIPMECDPRMMVQQGVFTIHGDPTPLDQFPKAPEFLVRLHIPARAKANFQRDLAAFGIDRIRLFPDLQNLSYALVKTELTRWNTPGIPPPPPAAPPAPPVPTTPPLPAGYSTGRADIRDGTIPLDFGPK